MTFYPVNFPFFLWKKKLSLPLEGGGASPNILTCISPGRPPSTRTLPRLVHLMFPTGRARVFGCCPARARRPMRIPFPVTPHGATEKRSAPLLRRACRKFSHARSPAPSPPPLSLSLPILSSLIFSRPLRLYQLEMNLASF
jgi:hypothetical protein